MAADLHPGEAVPANRPVSAEGNKSYMQPKVTFFYGRRQGPFCQWREGGKKLSFNLFFFSLSRISLLSILKYSQYKDI
jgi:hypothetical protein